MCTSQWAWGGPQPPERLPQGLGPWQPHLAPARGRGARESRGWGRLAGAGGGCQDMLPPGVPGRGYHQGCCRSRCVWAAVDPWASLPGSGPGHRGLQRASPGLGLRLKPAVPLQVSAATASPRPGAGLSSAGASIPGHSCMACWDPQALREGEAEGGGQASSCTCGRRGVCAELGNGGCPGSPGQSRAEPEGRGHRGAAPGFPSLSGSTKQCPLCPGLEAHHCCSRTGWAGWARP